jgi:hypothetical protein
VIVRTRWSLPARPDQVWPLLCSSSMDRNRPCFFHLGVPKPVACRLPSGEGVGARRECISEQGAVRQRITRWDAPRGLSFELVDTDLQWRRYVDAIEESFDLEATGPATRVLRTTNVRLKSGQGRWRALLLHLGLKQVHRYVFRNWAAALSPPPQRA